MQMPKTIRVFGIRETNHNLSVIGRKNDIKGICRFILLHFTYYSLGILGNHQFFICCNSHNNSF